MKTYDAALILGYGRSGRAAERMLQAEVCETIVLSQETAGDNDVSMILKSKRFDVCIVSPGFGLNHPWINAIENAGIPLLSELELGWSRHSGKTVAITGSNGKSTAVKLVHESLLLAGKKSAIGGNYGIPACEVVMENPDLDWLVLEVSSFQLETVCSFRADVAVVLNVLPNHLDRHETMACYRQTKARIFENSATGDLCLVPADLREIKKDVEGERNWLTFGRSADADYRFDDGKVFQGNEAILDLSCTLFDSPTIGGCTGAAAAGIAQACGISFLTMKQAAKDFKALPHRIQRLGEIDGITYINDSKATNLAAMATALLATGENIHLIAGGLPKESDYTIVKEILAERVRNIYVIGQASRDMKMAWNGVSPCVECGTLDRAFATARNAAGSGDFILLSPGCASFDQFRSFEERGARFEALFRELKQAGGEAS